MRFHKLLFIFPILILANSLCVFSQEAIFYGARNESLARATVALNDSWALFYNPAGLVYQQVEVVAGYQSKYTSLGIDDGAFGFTFPIKNTALGIGASYFGDNLLSKSKVVASIAHKISKTSLGIKTTYDQLRINEIGSKGIFYLDIGGQISINEQVIIGMVINNINQAKFDTLSISSPNTSVQVGINYHPHGKLILLAQIEKDISNPAILRLALEYSISKYVVIRTGVLPSPTAAFAGVGLNWAKFKLDLVASYQQSLGWSGGLSIGIPLVISDAK
ncbi:MAG: hypothetical protein L3J29_02625 [Cyclobacteriaceae bacterium]|nr:hypothetical protein [Cyclobacteriaceae bacterium]